MARLMKTKGKAIAMMARICHGPIVRTSRAPQQDIHCCAALNKMSRPKRAPNVPIAVCLRPRHISANPVATFATASPKEETIERKKEFEAVHQGYAPTRDLTRWSCDGSEHCFNFILQPFSTAVSGWLQRFVRPMILRLHCKPPQSRSSKCSDRLPVGSARRTPLRRNS